MSHPDAQAARPRTKAQAKAAGYTVDESCYPWIAYKGPRFQPTEHFAIMTDREAALDEALTAYAATPRQSADSGRVGDEMVEKAREAYFNASKVEDGVYTDPVAMRAALEAALAAQGRGEQPKAFGMACKVAWTELHNAMAEDGMNPPTKCGKATRKWIEEVVRNEFANLPTPAASPAGVPDGYVLVPREPTFAMQAAHQIHGDTSDWWNAVIEAAAPSAPEGDGSPFCRACGEVIAYDSVANKHCACTRKPTQPAEGE